MHVPVAPVNIDHLPTRAKNDVRCSREVTAMQPVSITESVNETAHHHLGFRIFSSYPTHVQLALSRCQNVHHR